jgi:hypothetical protein
LIFFSLSRNCITRFEDLSNEVIYEIFEFLDFCQVYEIFFHLNIRFENLLKHSTLPIKIELISLSKSTFQRYYTKIVIPNQHRIESLHLSNSFIIDRIFSSKSIHLKLTRLERLNVNEIQSTSIKNLLEYLLILPSLSSLIINCRDPDANKNNLYKQIFRLPVLKYCRLSLYSNNLEPLPIATNKYSPIEHFVLNCSYVEHDLNNLLSYVPNLNRLSIQSPVDSPVPEMRPYSSALKHLTHVSLNCQHIPFDQFESMSQSFFNQVQVLRVSQRYNEQYLYANQWQRVILSHMSHLRIFDIYFNYILSWADNITDFITLIDKFNSRFWFERQWFFEYHVDGKHIQDSLSFYSTNPYR